MKKIIFAVIAGVAVTAFFASPLRAYDEMKVVDGGILEGTVVFQGPPPSPRKVIPTKDQEVCGGPRDEPRIILGPDNGVKDAIVYLKGVERGKTWERPDKPPTIDNVQCRFQPKVQVVPRGTIVVMNSDPVLHNTHGFLRLDGRRRTIFNEAMPKKGQQFKANLRLPGIIDIECDAHGWMQAWMLVAENPYYAITDEKGNFKIQDIPAGQYTLVTFQHYTGSMETPVTIKAKERRKVKVELKK